MTDGRLVDFYSCEGKADGGHVHPTDCHKWIICVDGMYAYENECPDCHIDPNNCPDGKLYYDHGTDHCLFLSEAGCVTESSGY
ncbi:chitin binding peritrophin-A domain-containing protein [Nocardia sp. NPDC049149]|uniref:chitin binding peritrophin-A domain-containing protein n=1 Tax=Nocardia sp. NPDC049149 TaxID=3364315 RepID=UPI0037127504